MMRRVRRLHESPFGRLLRHWRNRAGLSQLELAAEAETTPRYVSFLETGRARPGAALVSRLAVALDVPIAERNAMLEAAGLAPVYPRLALEGAGMAPIRGVLDRVLRNHEPYPAWVAARGFRFLSSNHAAESLFPGLCGMSPEAIVDLWFGAGPFRSLVENWQDVVWAGVASLRREVSRTLDQSLLALLRRAESHLREVPSPAPDALLDWPLVSPRLRIGEHRIRTIATVMRFDAAVELTTDELRVELMFPADEPSDRYFRERATETNR